jgi:hypothetical protein
MLYIYKILNIIDLLYNALKARNLGLMSKMK